MKIVEEIRKFVEEESKKPSNIWGYSFYTLHLVDVYNLSRELAKKLDADLEVVELAAWLHDIGAIFNGRENHHITGALIAEKKLNELGYPEQRIEIVKRCILNHRGSISNEKCSVEEQIIADADAMSAFNHLQGLFFAAYVSEKKGQEDARNSVRIKLVNSWNKLCFQESREIIKPKYEAAMLLLT